MILLILKRVFITKSIVGECVVESYALTPELSKKIGEFFSV
jgi:hypothetical protein